MHLPIGNRRVLLGASLALVVILAVVLLPTRPARGTDPDALASTYLASGPVINQQTAEANQAWAAAIDTREAQDHDYAIAHPETLAQKDPNRAIPTSLPEPTVEAGIYTDLQRPMGWGGIYGTENAWMGIITGGYAQVFAGLKSDSPEPGVWSTTSVGQGVLVVLTFPDNVGNPANGGEYLTPTRAGSVHITAAVGTCLTVQAKNGDQLMFDVARRIWSCTR